MTTPGTPATIADEGLYESAVVYALPPTLHCAIDRWRLTLSELVRRVQLVPHLTLCFLGHMRGGELRRVIREFEAHRPKDMTVQLGPLGRFLLNGATTNLHIQVQKSEDLDRAHRAVHSVGEMFPWFDAGEYVLDGYTPHISLFDAVPQPDSVVDSCQPWWRAGDAVGVHSPHVIGKRLDPTPLFRWGDHD